MANRNQPESGGGVTATVPFASGFEEPLPPWPPPFGTVSTVALTNVDGSPFRYAWDITGVVAAPSGVLFMTYGHAVWRVSRARVVSLIAGSCRYAGDEVGDGVRARFNRPCGPVLSPDGVFLVVADSGNHKLKQIVVASGVVSVLAGSGDQGGDDEIGDEAQFNYPRGLSFSPDGAFLVVADLLNHKVRKVGMVQTYATGASSLASKRTHGATNNAEGQWAYHLNYLLTLASFVKVFIQRDCCGAGNFVDHVKERRQASKCCGGRATDPRFAPYIVEDAQLARRNTEQLRREMFCLSIIMA